MLVSELNSFVRFTLGGLSDSVLDDITLNQIIQNVLDAGLANTDCQEKFYSVRQTLIYLDTKMAAGSAGTGASGALKSIEEEIGKRKIKKTWETSGSSGEAASWKTVLEDFLSEPQVYLLCEPFPSTDGTSGSKIVIIGGADVNGVEAVYESRMRRDKASYDYRSPTNFPWRPSRY